jgi:hypothetical protein
MWDDIMRELINEQSAKTKSAVQTVDGEAVGSPVRNVDADTLEVSGKKYRLQGFNAPETAKFHGSVFIPGQQAGDRTQENVNQVAQLGGYTNLKPTGKKDAYGRILAQQTDAQGNELGDTVTALGLTEMNQYSDLKAVAEHGVINAMSRIMPSMAQADPMIRLAREEHEKRVKENGGNPLYIPKLVMADEAQYAAAKTMVGNQAVKEQIDEIDRLEGILKDPGLRPDTRAKLEKQRDEAKDKLFFAGTTPDFAGSVAMRKNDRTIMNQAHKQFSTSFDSAMSDLRKGFYGYAQMAGDGMKWDWLANKGREGVLTEKVVAGLLPDTLGSIRDVRTDGDTWDTITDAATYAGNLLAGTLPMMGMMMGAAMAAPVVAPTAGVAAMLSAVPSALAYSGQFYADQPDDKKNSALALSAGIGSAVLDRVGLEGIIKGGDIFSQVGRKEVLGTMMQSGRYQSQQEAEKVLADATKATIIELSGAGAEFAAKHYASKEAMLAGIRSIGTAAAGEAVTESGQTLLELFATSGEIDPDLRYEKNFYTALTDAAIGGGLMGGGLHAGGVAIDAAQWGSAANAKKIYEGNLNDAQAFQAQQKQLKEVGVPAGDPRGVTSVLEGLSNVNAITVSQPIPGLMDMPGKPGVWNGFLSVVKDPVRLLRSLADTTVKSLRKENGELKFYSAILKSVMQPGILPGDSFDGFRQRIIGEWNTTDAETLTTELKVPVRRASQMLKQAWQSTWSQGKVMAGSPEAEALQRWKDEADAVTGQATQLLGELGYDTSNIGKLDAVFVDAAIDPTQIAKNESRLIQTMTTNGSSVREAREAIQGLISGDRGTADAAKHWMETHGVFHDPGLNDLFEPNIFAAFENFKHHVATDAANKLYLGENGQNLARLVHMAAQAGEFSTEAEYLDTVQNVQDFYKIATGTYNTLENYPFIEKMVGWGVTATMLASLGKATLSSLPEIAMSTMGTSGDKVHSQLKIAVEEMFSELGSEINKGISWSSATLGMSYARSTPNGRAQVELRKLDEEFDALGTNPNTTPEQMAEFAKKVKKFHKKYMGRSLFERLGYNDSGYNTQAKFETNTANMKKTMQVFSSMIGLHAITNATRIATLSMAGDIVNGKLTSLLVIPIADRSRVFQTGADMTNEQYQSLRELQSWGMDVEKVLGLIDQMNSTDPAALDEMIETIAVGNRERLPIDNPVQQLRDEVMVSLRNMVDQRVTNPQTANLPKYYHDPRLRVFTAMTRFVAGMTANILPRMYKDYIKNGSTGMRYQAFATMAMSMVFAHMANMLKDILAYGDDENPYLKSNVKKTQRALYGSGLIGRAESLMDTVSPLYSNKKADPTKDPFTYAYQSLRDASPPLGWSDRAVRAMYELGAGDTATGVKNTVKSLPLVGSFPIAATTAAKLVKE